MNKHTCLKLFSQEIKGDGIYMSIKEEKGRGRKRIDKGKKKKVKEALVVVIIGSVVESRN